MTRVCTTFLYFVLSISTSFGIDRFVSLLGTHQAPFTNWPGAATNIQAAIDAASAGDKVWVTNGIYSTGGKVMAGGLTNRVALDKALTVQSMNGAEATIIQGTWSATTNGLNSVRCAWMTNGTTLKGFTLSGGATIALASPSNQQMNGGGAWCASTNSLLISCIISNNACAYNGGGVYQGMLTDCTIANNRAIGTGIPGSTIGNSGDGGGAIGAILNNCLIAGNSANNNAGGASSCNLQNCALTGNSSYLYGAAAYHGVLLNCTVTGNTSGGYGSQGAAVTFSYLTNSIVVSNLARTSGLVGTNYFNSTSIYCCMIPAAPGAGNIAVDPQLLIDGVHISQLSPCRGAGTNVVNGTDIDGQNWLNPPSIGCDEWLSRPVIARQPKFQTLGFPATLNCGSAIIAGQEPFSFTWLKDGTLLSEGIHFTSVNSSNLVVKEIGLADSGNYQMIAGNGSGSVTSAIVSVKMRGVDAASVTPVTPYSNWTTAASNIQDAIDSAEDGDIILVTNGLYNSGGKVMAGDLTNRIALTRSLTVQSINGPSATIIQGVWDPNTNGPLAVRCAWLTNGAVLNGFTLFGGATRTNGGSALQSGGGIWGLSTQAQVVNCFIFTNSASAEGGGNYQAALSRCKVVGNQSSNGGGSAFGSLRSTLLAENFAKNNGGGVCGGDVNNCTIVDNNAATAGGMYAISTPPHNSIIYGNNLMTPFSIAEYFSLGVGNPSYCCVYTSSGSPYSGTGNIGGSPQFTDDLHVAITSPCRGTGSALYSSGTDFDGEPWMNPPSIGCDEFFEGAINGPLFVGLNKQWEEVVENQLLYLFSTVTGRVTRATWSFGDGSVLTNLTAMSLGRRWTNPGDYTVTFTAYNSDKTNGVSASIVVHVIPLIKPTVSSFNLSGTNFTLNFMPQQSVNYYVERATNLVPPIVWQMISNVYGATNLTVVIDKNATNATRFYRVRVSAP